MLPFVDAVQPPIWFVVDKADNKTKGPFTERDLDVMWRTSELDSKTLVWRQGMPQWRPMFEVPEIQQNIFEKQKHELFEAQTAAAEPQQQIQKQQQPQLPQKQQQQQPSTTQVSKPTTTTTTDTNTQILQKALDEDEDDEDEDDDEEESEFEKQLKEMIKQDILEVNGIEDETKKAREIKRVSGQSKKIKKEQPKKVEKTLENAKTEDEKTADPSKPKDPLSIIRSRFPDLTDDQLKKKLKNKRKNERRKEKKKNQWHEPKINTSIYIKGLPEDITIEEMKTFFSKGGIFRIDPLTGLEKIKIYQDDEKHFKGDGLVSYAKPESVELAYDLLHEREIRPGVKILIEKAKFEKKQGKEILRKLPLTQAEKINILKVKADQERSLGWDDDEKGEGLKIVILKHMFTLEEASQDVYKPYYLFQNYYKQENYFNSLKEDIISECDAKLGQVQRIKFYENNPEGIVLVKFKDDKAAEECIQLMNGRYFNERQIECFYYDGATNYDQTEAAKQVQESRLEEFGNWLESQKTAPKK